MQALEKGYNEELNFGPGGGFNGGGGGGFWPGGGGQGGFGPGGGRGGLVWENVEVVDLGLGEVVVLVQEEAEVVVATVAEAEEDVEEEVDLVALERGRSTTKLIKIHHTA